MFLLLFISLISAQTCPSTFENNQFNLPPILDIDASHYSSGILTLKLLLPSLYFNTHFSLSDDILNWTPTQPSAFWSLSTSNSPCYVAYTLTTNYTNIASSFELLEDGDDLFVTSKVIIQTSANVAWEKGVREMEFESAHPFKLRLPSYVQAHATAYVLGSAPDLPLDSVNVFTKIATVHASEITLQFDTITQWPFQFSALDYSFRPEFGDSLTSTLTLVSTCDSSELHASQSFLPDGRSECLQSWELVFDGSAECQVTDSFLLGLNTECIQGASCSQNLFTSETIDFTLHTTNYCPVYLGNVTMEDCPRFTPTTVGILAESHDFQPQFSPDGETLTLTILMSNQFWDQNTYDTTIRLDDWTFSNSDSESSEVTIFENDECSTGVTISAAWSWWLQNGDWINDNTTQIVTTVMNLDAISQEAIFTPDVLDQENGFRETMSSVLTIDVSYFATGSAVTESMTDGSIIYAPPSVYSVAISKELSDVTIPSPMEVDVMGATLTLGVVTTTQYPYYVSSMTDVQSPETVTMLDSTYQLVQSCDGYVATVEGVEVCVQQWMLTFRLQGCNLAGNYTATLATECNPNVLGAQSCPTLERPLTISLPSEHFCPHMADKQAEMPVVASLDAFDSTEQNADARSSWFLDQIAYFRITLSTTIAEFTDITLVQVSVTQNDVETVVFDEGETLPGYESLAISTQDTDSRGYNSWEHIGLAYQYFDMTLSSSFFTAEQWTHSAFEVTAVVEYSFENGSRRRQLFNLDSSSKASKILHFRPTMTSQLALDMKTKQTKNILIFLVLFMGVIIFVSLGFHHYVKTFMGTSYEKVQNTFLV